MNDLPNPGEPPWLIVAAIAATLIFLTWAALPIAVEVWSAFR
jgi:hypothetical protein